MNKKILVLCATLVTTPLHTSNNCGPEELAQLYSLVLLGAAAYATRFIPLANPYPNLLNHKATTKPQILPLTRRDTTMQKKKN